MEEVAAPVSHKPTAGMPDALNLADSTKVKGESGQTMAVYTIVSHQAAHFYNS
jgi:hypothetical protein